MRCERILAAVEASPWAIHPDKLRVIESVLARKIAGEEVSDQEIEAAVSKKKQGKQRRDGSVAVIPIHGTITQRADWLTEWSGGASTEQIGQMIDEAAADPAIQAIILNVDSSGGSVYGVEELAVKIHSTSKQKKVVAAVDSVAASAAYWLASQASELVVTPNGEVGSIGVYILHVDRSEAMAKYGHKPTYVKAGERKTAGHPYGPLDEIGRAELQAGVDDYYDKFVRAVARGRNATLSAVRDGYGRGGMVRAEQAVKEGMADRVATFESVLARYGLTLQDTTPAADNSDVEVRRRRMLLDD